MALIQQGPPDEWLGSCTGGTGGKLCQIVDVQVGLRKMNNYLNYSLETLGQIFAV